jgi:glycosyltransferase involved in cell wall biosynthesis
LLWSYQAFAPEILDWPARVRVFDAVDDWSLHASYQKEADFLRKNYDRISQKADVIFTVSAGLAERFDPAKTRWIPNGIDPAPFTKDWPMPSDLAALPRPLIGYVGTVQERLDFALLKTVCRNHADKSFVFIGPVWKGVADQVASLSTACPNVHFLGRRPYEQTPAYLQAMDIAIIPHRLDAFLSSTNPMKMYDYLAAGKPIVSTPGAGTEAFAQHIVIAKDAAEFSEAINRALAADSPAQHQARQSALSGHLWSDRLAAMQAFLRDRLRFP